MSDPNAKHPRTFQCRDILWDALEQMAGELECSVDYLANEALKVYVRQRGGRLPVVMRLLDEPAAPPRAPQAATPPPPPPRMVATPPPGHVVPPPPVQPMTPLSPIGPPNLQDGVTVRPGPIAGAPPPPLLVSRAGALPGMHATPMPPRPGSMSPAVEGGLQGKPGPGQAPAMPPGPPPLPNLRPMERSNSPNPLPGPPLPPGVPAGYGGPRYPPPTPLPAAAAPVPGAPPPGMHGLPPRPPPPPPPIAGPSTLASNVPATAASGPVPSPPLFVLYAGERYEVAKERFIIGRGRQAVDLTIKDPNISRHHAMIEYHGGQYFIVDMGSTNGIEHEGQRITRKPVVEGDIIRICDHEVRFTYR